jgi:adenosylcobyric acid synthase
MVQGSASGVGKSVIATALCRVLRDAGHAVAPFKAQNMSLNVAATLEGGEIGRAQAAQAEAAGVIPRAVMNPVLLKPEADTRSQIVVMGKATGSRATRAYWRGQHKLWPVIRSALRELRTEFDTIVIEGAGSPAELNLRDHDLVNMRVASEADAGVVLVGDIERGGIFAQLLGTLDLLMPAERRRVRALVVNKFRGDMSLFADGVRILRERSGLPVYVLPYVEDLGVPSEDALAPQRAGADAAPELALVVTRTSVITMTSSRSRQLARVCGTCGVPTTSSSRTSSSSQGARRRSPISRGCAERASPRASTDSSPPARPCLASAGASRFSARSWPTRWVWRAARRSFAASVTCPCVRPSRA